MYSMITMVTIYTRWILMKTWTTYLHCLSYYVFQINVLSYMSWHVAQYFKDENLFPMHVLIAHMPCYLIRKPIVHHFFVCSSAVVTLFDCMICLPPYFCNINTNKRVLVNCMLWLKIPIFFPWLQQQSSSLFKTHKWTKSQEELSSYQSPCPLLKAFSFLLHFIDF